MLLVTHPLQISLCPVLGFKGLFTPTVTISRGRAGGAGEQQQKSLTLNLTKVVREIVNDAIKVCGGGEHGKGPAK